MLRVIYLVIFGEILQIPAFNMFAAVVMVALLGILVAFYPKLALITATHDPALPS